LLKKQIITLTECSRETQLFDEKLFQKLAAQLVSQHTRLHRTEVRFASFLSDGFTTMAVINPPESKLAKRTSVHRCDRSVGY
jgi:hypothetical protein